MCFGQGSRPQAPTIEYVGPSNDAIQRNDRQVAAYQEQIQKQQAVTAQNIQTSINAANTKTAEIQSQFDQELAIAQGDTSKVEDAAALATAEALEAKQAAAAAAGASYTPIGAYGVTASETEAPAAKTTAPIKAKKKPKTTLKISPTATAQQGGTGLNIGV